MRRAHKRGFAAVALCCAIAACALPNQAHASDSATGTTRVTVRDERAPEVDTVVVEDLAQTGTVNPVACMALTALGSACVLALTESNETQRTKR